MNRNSKRKDGFKRRNHQNDSEEDESEHVIIRSRRELNRAESKEPEMSEEETKRQADQNERLAFEE